MKAGDVIRAKEDLFMNPTKKQELTKGNNYAIIKVVDVFDEFIIKNDSGDDHHFTLESFDDFFEKLKPYHDKIFGKGFIIDSNENEFIVKFESDRIVKFPHMRNEKAVSIVIWSVIFIVCFMSFLGWLL